MADSSPNALSPPQNTTAARPELQQVYREPIELFRLEQMLPFAKTAQEEYTIYSLIITRELAQALIIPRPEPMDPLWEEWGADMEELKLIREQFVSRTVPIPKFPGMMPQTGRDIPEYDIEVEHGDYRMVLAPDMPGFLQLLNMSRLQAAYARALQPMPGWHLAIRTMLAKYKIWDLDSEFSSMLSVNSDSEMEKNYNRGASYVERMRRRGAAVGGDTEDVVTDAPMDEDGDADDPGDGDPSQFK